MQGLFALIELAELKKRTIAASGMDPQSAGSYIRSRVALIMASPLITVGGDKRHEGVRPVSRPWNPRCMRWLRSLRLWAMMRFARRILRTWRRRTLNGNRAAAFDGGLA